MKLSRKTIPFLLIPLVSFLISSCNHREEGIAQEKLFTQVPPSKSGVGFINRITESESFYYHQYIYSYIGGGVATADFNNDGLTDLFFTSNQESNKLYLNIGAFTFDDITESAQIKHDKGFDTGVTVVDINNDGFLDIYICKAGWYEDGELYANKLLVNNGDLTFTERANEFGLDDKSRSIAASFFDYDKDGDLDVYIANGAIVTRDYRKIIDLEMLQKDPATIGLRGSDKLYRNEGTGKFKDVSVEAGILPERGFGLNPQVIDLNNDGWLDIYVSNDFETPDYAYLNNKNGTFSEGRDQLLKHMSFYSMGSDFGDINNDGLNDFVVLDMNPEDYIRSKTTMAMTSLDKFDQMIEKGYHRQYMHNMLQVNNGNGTFSEIAQMAGFANTDWSWSVLMSDFDLDGYNDLYISNGVFRDVIDQDKTKEIMTVARRNGRKPTNADYLQFTQMLPQQKLTNYIFKNNGDLTFENTSVTWADSTATFSNGAAYADLDNDGDLDMVVNNINEEATILKNNAIEQSRGKYLQIKFKGASRNRNGIGTIAKVKLLDGSIHSRQLINSRGFLSSVSNTLHFGFKKSDSIESLKITWTDDKTQEFKNLECNQLLVAHYEKASTKALTEEEPPTVFDQQMFLYEHIDPVYNDYEKQILLPHKLSQLGPAIAKADVNGDSIEDVYLGGAHDQAGRILVGKKSGYLIKPSEDFEIDKAFEDVAAAFIDADGDGDQDLYVVSGSYEFEINDLLQQDRLYLNDGKGVFKKSKNRLPQMLEAGSVVKPADFDRDGDVDLFVGARVVPGKYPYAPKSSLLVNDKGVFTDVTKELAPDLQYTGMITDACWADMNGDGYLDLIVTGEWMGIEIFQNVNGMFSRQEEHKSLAETVGWWNRIVAEDIDQDGDIDIIAGNLGLNSKFHASVDQPFHVYTNDFDNNGTEDVFLAKYYKGLQVSVRGKTCTAQQMPHLANKITTYNEFANLDIAGIVGQGIESALHYEATEFRSGIFKNNGGGNFSFIPFSNENQTSSIRGILYEDMNQDGIKDLILAGNNYNREIETTRSDAGIGAFLKGNGDGTFVHISHQESGFMSDKDARNLLVLTSPNGKSVLVVNNNDKHELFVSHNDCSLFPDSSLKSLL